jgi:pSer/pThr/pTyr-binding forkhead associated (FHA) protein
MASQLQSVDRLALIWMRADGMELEFPVWAERPVTIGRDVTNAVALESGFVSKNHAILTYVDGGFVLEDLRSANGTRVNGVTVDEAAAVAPGDELEIGDQRLLFVDRSTQEATPASKGLGKTARLAIVGIGTLVVFGGLAMLLRPNRETTGVVPVEPVAVTPQVAAAPSAIAPLMAAIGERARAAGITLEDALVDEAIAQERNGRLLEAEALFATILASSPKHELASVRLPLVASARERAVQDALLAGHRSTLQLQYSDAALYFERVLTLTPENDQRRQTAVEGLRTAQAAVAR